MKYTKLILTLVILTFGMVGTANADSLFTYHFSDGIDEADLWLTGEVLPPSLSPFPEGPWPQMHFITAGTMHVTAGDAAGWYSLIPVPAPVFLPFVSPSGAFTADNILYHGLVPSLDFYGLLFGNSTMEVNLWGNPDGTYGFAGWTLGDPEGTPYDPDFDGTEGPSTLVETPETASVMLLGLGLLGLAFGQKRLFKLTA